MALRVDCLCVDAHDPVVLGRWWGELLGWDVDDKEADEVEVKAPAGTDAGGISCLLFLGVPDDKVVKNRLHIDLRPDDRDAEVARAESLGARRVDIGQGEQTWVVLADPEGNELCILRALQ